MIVSFEILETEEIRELQTKVLENKQQTEEEHDAWMSDTDKIDDYIIQCLSDLISKRKSGDTDMFDVIVESHIWEYQVCTNDREELYLM